MGWIIAIVALSLVMTVLTIAELRQPVRTNVSSVPALNIGDRVIGIFVVITFAVALINGLMLVAVKILP
jgi:predicted S18 family serine protease